MELASAVVGLLLAGTKVCLTLEAFVSNCKDAPRLAQEMLGEVRDFQYALRRLRKYTERPTQITPLGAVATDVGHLSLTLGSCMATFSQLERTVDRLIPAPSPEMSMFSKLRWARATPKISELVRRLQQHKATITMLLTIWISESTSETEVLVDSLNDVLRNLTSPTTTPPLQGPILHAGLPSNPELPGVDLQTETAGDLSFLESDTLSVVTTASRISLKSVLRKARPYRNLKIFDQPEMSIFSLERGETHWSSFSGGSTASVFSLPYTEFQFSHKTLAEEKAISRVQLPVEKELLYRPTWYRHTGLLDANGGPNINGYVSVGACLGLLQNPKGINPRQYESFLCHAVACRNISLIQVLLDMHEYPMEHTKKTRNLNPIIEAFYYALPIGEPEIVLMLLDRGLKLGELGRDPHQSIVGGLDGEGRHPLDLPYMRRDEQMLSFLLDRGVTPDPTLVRHCLAKCINDNTRLDLLVPDWMTDGKAIDTIPLIHLVVQFGNFCTLEPLLDQLGSTGAIIAHFDNLSIKIGLNQYQSFLCQAAALGKVSHLWILLDISKQLVEPAKASGIATVHTSTSVPKHIFREAFYLAIRTDNREVILMLLDRGLKLGELGRDSYQSIVGGLDGEGWHPLDLPYMRRDEQMLSFLLDRGATPDPTLVRHCLANCFRDNTRLDLLVPDWMTDGKAIDTIPLIHLVVQFGKFCTLEPLLDQLGSTGAIIAHFDNLSIKIGLNQYQLFLYEAAALDKRSHLRILLDIYKQLVEPAKASGIATVHTSTSVPEHILLEALYGAVHLSRDGYEIIHMLVDAGINLGEVKRKSKTLPGWPRASRWHGHHPLDLPVARGDSQMTALLVDRGAVPDYTVVYRCIVHPKKSNELLNILVPDWMTEGKAIEGILLIHLVAKFGSACTLEPLLDQWNDTSSISTLLNTLYDLAVRAHNDSTKRLLLRRLSPAWSL